VVVTIRRATGADVDAVAALRRRWTREDADPGDLGADPGDLDADDPGADAEFAGWMAAWWDGVGANRAVFLAERHDDPVGMINLAVFDRMPKPGRPTSRWGYLGNAYVLAELRGHGIGSRLLDAVLGHAREIGCVRVVLAPTERSVPFYRRAGFGPATMLMALPLDG
jgi:GNAT superfamily N-acetyltransferase